MKRLLLLLALCGSAWADTVHQIHFILRPASDGRWYIQSDNDHAPQGMSLYIEQTSSYIRVFFDRNYDQAGVIQVTSDDDFAETIKGYSNLGLGNATIQIRANGVLIDPATVPLYVTGGNLWVSAWMVSHKVR